MQGANTFLAIVSAVICVIITALIIVSDKKEGKVSIGLYLVLIGGLGNLIDRVFRGFVVDFIDTPFIATFNIADSFIVIGAFWVMIEEICKSIFISKK